MTATDLASLQERAAKLTKLEGFKKHYALFSKNSFTARLTKEIPESTMLAQGGERERVA